MNTGAVPVPAERAPRCTVSVIINAASRVLQEPPQAWVPRRQHYA